MSDPRILVFAGSARAESFTKRLAKAAAMAIEAAGATATFVDLGDYPAPIYHGDDEAANGLPEAMTAMKKLIAEHDGMAVATPEYNGCPPPLLVNLFAWASRPGPGESGPMVFAGKPVALMGASPGGLGGVRVIPRLRDAMAELGCVAVPGFVTLPRAMDGFAEDGALKAEPAKGQLDGLVGRLIEAARG